MLFLLQPVFDMVILLITIWIELHSYKGLGRRPQGLLKRCLKIDDGRAGRMDRTFSKLAPLSLTEIVG